jgi:malonyl-CoA/methylmalonyl-CoA synthetase
VQVDKSPEAMLLCLACFRRGAVYLPLNPAHTAAEIDYFLTDAEPTLFICRPEALDQHRAAPSQGLAVESLGRHGDGTLLDRASALPPAGNGPPAAPDDLAAILYTSGTTGRSKGAMMTHDNLVSNCRALIDAWRFVAEDRLVHALPIFHTHGLFVAGNMSVATGATMIFLDAFDTDAVLDALRDATVLMGVPTFYTRLLQSDRLTRDAVARVRLFVSGSAPLLAETHAAFTARTGQAILERYGMTETGMITSNPYDGERRPGTVGFPLPGVTIRVTDRETGAALPDGEVGVIEVQGPNVFRGYWRMSDKTAAEFRPDGYFITGDLARIDADGYTHIVGRAKDLVISGGNNVYPKEVEQALDALEGVLESAVIGLPHPDLGEAVTAIVVLRPGAKPAEDGLRAGLTDTLARYKQPRRILFAEALPRNVMGKVQKAALRERHATLYEAPASGARS